MSTRTITVTRPSESVQAGATQAVTVVSNIGSVYNITVVSSANTGPTGASPSVAFAMTGGITVLAGTSRYYMNRSGSLTNVIASLATAPTGSTAIFDVMKNGVSVFATPANRPTIAIGGYVDLSSIPDTQSFVAGDYFTVDVVQVGSTIAGSNLVVQLELV